MISREREVVRDGYDQIASSYLEERPHTGRDVTLLMESLNELPIPSRVLDAGCGAGSPVTSRLLATGHDVVGLDISLVQLALARAIVTRAGLVQADLSELPFGSNSFDALVSFYAIIHVRRQEHEQAFREFRRVLRPNGRALLCLGWGDLPADHDPDSWLGVPMFWSHFDGETNLKMLSEAGLTPTWSGRVDDPMGHAAHQFVLATGH